ncbi:MAG: DUF167 domain-containing protein [bacterium]
MTAAPCALRSVPGGVELAIRVKPRASRTALVGLREGAFEVRVAAPPVDDAANEELIRFLAKRLAVPQRDLSITRGERSRHKTIHAAGLSADQATARLVPTDPAPTDPG